MAVAGASPPRGRAMKKPPAGGYALTTTARLKGAGGGYAGATGQAMLSGNPACAGTSRNACAYANHAL